MNIIDKFQWRGRDDSACYFEPSKTRFTYVVLSLLPEIQGAELSMIDNNHIDTQIVLGNYGSVEQAKKAAELHYYMVSNFWIKPPFEMAELAPN